MPPSSDEYTCLIARIRERERELAEPGAQERSRRRPTARSADVAGSERAISAADAARGPEFLDQLRRRERDLERESRGDPDVVDAEFTEIDQSSRHPS